MYYACSLWCSDPFFPIALTRPVDTTHRPTIGEVLASINDMVRTQFSRDDQTMEGGNKHPPHVAVQIDMLP